MALLRLSATPHATLGLPTLCEDTMVSLAEDGMTMLCVTHEMSFARQVANRVIFMDRGRIIEENTPTEFFDHPRHERTRLFLSQILH